MLLLLILPILVSGFIYIHADDKSYFKLHRTEGQYLYLKTIKNGLLITISVSTIIFFLNKLPVFCIADVEVDILKILQSDFMIFFEAEEGGHTSSSKALTLAWIVCITLSSLITSWFYPTLNRMFKLYVYKLVYKVTTSEDFKIKASRAIRLFNELYNKETLIVCKLYKRFKFKRAFYRKYHLEISMVAKSAYKTDLLKEVLNDSPLDRLLLSALVEKKLLMLTLQNRQVYIGKLNSTGEPNENEGLDQEICLIPLMSGYRDDKTLELNLVTHYKTLNIDIFLTLRQSEIISVTEFDLSSYEKLQKTKVKKERKGFAVNFSW